MHMCAFMRPNSPHDPSPSPCSLNWKVYSFVLMSRLTSLMAPCLVGYAAALSRGMTNLRDSGEFDPKERPFRITTTDVNEVSMYLEHLLDVSMEEHTFSMDFYFTREWMDDRNYRRGLA